MSNLETFTFGDPVPVMDGREVLDYTECWLNGRWYEPPVNMAGLAKSFHSSTHHASAIYFKRNLLVSTFIPHRLLGLDAFGRFALDFLVFGNAYLEKQQLTLKQHQSLAPVLAKYIRRGKDLVTYYRVMGWRNEHEFDRDTIFHLLEPDIHQEVYGLPEYLGALQSAWLNEAATLFRRRYYTNGSHAGFILYMTDAANDQQDIDKIRESLKNAKGPGNFRNLFVYAPNGKKDGMQLIPVSEVVAKDEFLNIKNVTRDDMLAAHRVPPQLIGIVPVNSGGFGSVKNASQVYASCELAPLQEKFRQLNDWIGDEVITFKPYELTSTVSPSADK